MSQTYESTAGNEAISYEGTRQSNVPLVSGDPYHSQSVLGVEREVPLVVYDEPRAHKAYVASNGLNVSVDSHAQKAAAASHALKASVILNAHGQLVASSAPVASTSKVSNGVRRPTDKTSHEIIVIDELSDDDDDDVMILDDVTLTDNPVITFAPEVQQRVSAVQILPSLYPNRFIRDVTPHQVDFFSFLCSRCSYLLSSF